MKRSLIFIVPAVMLTGSHLLAVQTVNVDQNDANTGTLDNGVQFGHFDVRIVLGEVQHGGGPAGPPRTVNTPTGEGIVSKRSAGGNQYGLDFFTGNAPALSITHEGKVGIGIVPPALPAKALEIHGAGDVELGLQSSDPNGRLWTLQSSAVSSTGPNVSLNGTFQIIDRTAIPNQSRLQIDSSGTVTVNVLRIKGGADLAEPFQTAGDDLEPGSVVVIDDARPGMVKVSDTAYDRRVAGVVSGAGGIRSALTLAQFASADAGSQPDQNIALTGRVYVLADSSAGAIRPGDLLTTSAIPGRCMKASDYDRAKGAILGKAMGSLESGKGLVLALVTLQ